MLSVTKKKYLLTIYELGNSDASVRQVDIAKALNVRKASVSNMLPSLIEENLVTKNEYGNIEFTAEGARRASELYLKYLTLYSFFSKNLGSTDQNARKDAIICSCSLSDENTDSITDFILTKNNSISCSL